MTYAEAAKDSVEYEYTYNGYTFGIRYWRPHAQYGLEPSFIAHSNNPYHIPPADIIRLIRDCMSLYVTNGGFVDLTPTEFLDKILVEN